ncbi:MAG: hypothetical protein HQM09_09920 [Candidatus Riflebacteria bacterium]|nr:hypothetical protein [Candidatus Riflebacteria bacterium]
MNRDTRKTCSFCAFCFLLSIATGFATLIILSKMTFSLIIFFVQASFNLVRDLILALVIALGELPGWVAWPVVILLFFGLSWFIRKNLENRKWRGLEQIREEYEPLVRLLRRRGLKTYLIQIEKIREKIFFERQKIDGLVLLLDDELPKIESRMTEISNQLGQASEENEKVEMRVLLRQLMENSARLRNRKSDLARFEKSKIQLASHLNCLRMKLIETPSEESSLEESIKTINSISLLENMFRNDDSTGQ